jgi:lipoprotein-anchoring transpeptidase ErfK/SrfK
MSVYQKLQTSVGLNIVSSDNADIPTVGIVEVGTNTSTVANQLVDSAATFQTNNVQVGDIVYNNVTLQAATVTRVISQTVVELNANIFLSTGESYTVYVQNEKNAAVLFIGTGGKLRVLTAGGQDVIFDSILGGTFLPVQVLKVFQTGTTATNLVALW